VLIETERKVNQMATGIDTGGFFSPNTVQPDRRQTEFAEVTGRFKLLSEAYVGNVKCREEIDVTKDEIIISHNFSEKTAIARQASLRSTLSNLDLFRERAAAVLYALSVLSIDIDDNDGVTMADAAIGQADVELMEDTELRGASVVTKVTLTYAASTRSESSSRVD
jgi:hypothetical protein